jgi:hypothetical protein
MGINDLKAAGLNALGLKKENLPPAIQNILQSLEDIIGYDPLDSGTTTPQANEEISRYLPKYWTEHRPGDAPMEFAVGQIPFAALSGVKTLADLAKFGLTSATMYAGGEFGQKIGETWGPVGKGLGSLAGSIAGAFAGHGLTNLPSKVMTPRIAQAEETAWNAEKAAQLQAIEEEHTPIIAAAKEKAETAKNARALASEQLEKEQRERIEIVNAETKANEQAIIDKETERSANYQAAKNIRMAEASEEARRVEEATKNKATEIIETGSVNKGKLYAPQSSEHIKAWENIKKALVKVNRSLKLGMANADKSELRTKIADITSLLNEGYLTLDDAVILKQNLNHSLYGKIKTGGSYKKALTQLSSAVDDYIVSVGSKEHTALYKLADQQHMELVSKAAKESVEEFTQSQKAKIASIAAEKLSGEQKRWFDAEKVRAEEAYTAATAKQKAAIKEITDKTYKKYLQDIKAGRGGIGEVVDLVKAVATHKGTAGIVGATMGILGIGGPWGKLLSGAAGIAINAAAKEILIARKAFYNHPEIFKEVVNIITGKVKGDAPRMLAAVAQKLPGLK